MDQIWIDMRDRVRNGYGWGQVCLTPENFLKLVDALSAAEETAEIYLAELNGEPGPTGR
jgi:hypothetical protein